jgi:hypothetical protein
LRDRNAEFQSEQHRKRIGRRARKIEAVDFFNLLTGPELLETTESHLPEHRERLYPPTVALSMFMRQALNADGSCQKAVNGWAAQRAAEGLGVQSIRTGAYCKARQRLPVQMVTALTREAGRLIRLLMAQAALTADVHPRQLSFKHTVQLWTEWTACRVDLTADTATLFRLIAQPTVGNRPGRIEPRARKRRPKSYPWLKVPRAEARDNVRRYGHV